MATVYLLWDQYNVSLSFGDNRKLPLPPNMHKNSHLPEAHKSSSSLTAVSSRVNLSTRAPKNRRLPTRPNFAIFNAAWRLWDIQSTLQIPQVLILVRGIWVAAWAMLGVFSKTGDVFCHWSGLWHYKFLWLLAVDHSKIWQHNQKSRTSLAPLLCQASPLFVEKWRNSQKTLQFC